MYAGAMIVEIEMRPRICRHIIGEGKCITVTTPIDDKDGNTGGVIARISLWHYTGFPGAVRS